ncbi:hypothetical protein D3C73_1366340 [compost metagenome]
MPRLNGRKKVESPASLVVMRMSLSLMAKCTTAPRLKVSSGSRPPLLRSGRRSMQYCCMAAWTDWVKSVFNSTVATGMPLIKKARSISSALSNE